MAGEDIIMGVESCYYALLTSDTAAAIAYSAPVAIPGAVSISAKTNSSDEILYADDGPYATASSFGGIDVEVEIAEATLDLVAALTGASYSAGGTMYQSDEDSAPYLALMFRALKADGTYRYFALLKGKLTPVSDKFETKGDKAKFQTVTFSGSFITRQFVETAGGASGKSLYKLVSDDSSVAVWMTAANLTGASISALTCTPVPADSGSGIVVSSNMTWTYNNAIDPDFATNDYFTVTKADGTVVAGEVSIDATNKIVTFNPDSNLGSSTVYIAIASNAVKDVYGQQVGSNTVANWTTA